MAVSFFSVFYARLMKPLFFCFDAETMHSVMTNFGELLGNNSFSRTIISNMFRYQSPQLGKHMAGIYFPSPVGLSAGFDYEAKLTQILPALGFGFATVGTVTLHPYEGNTRPRLGRFPKSQALLVNKGFKTKGAKAIIRKLKDLTFEIPIGISIGSTNMFFPSLGAQVQDIVATFKLFERSKVQHAYYELNISCPNTAHGQPFLIAKNLQLLLQSLRKEKIKKPVFIKMPIDLSQKDTLALLQEANTSFVRGVIFGNLTKDKTNPDVHPDDRVAWQKQPGNLSGKPTWNRSNHWIHYTKKHFGNRFVIIGTGGIFSGEDAATKLDLGADLVQLITGMVYKGPQLIGEINKYLCGDEG